MSKIHFHLGKFLRAVMNVRHLSERKMSSLLRVHGTNSMHQGRVYKSVKGIFLKTTFSRKGTIETKRLCEINSFFVITQFRHFSIL